jgi:hypothetical protein
MLRRNGAITTLLLLAHVRVLIKVRKQADEHLFGNHKVNQVKKRAPLVAVSQEVDWKKTLNEVTIWIWAIGNHLSLLNQKD